MKAIYKIENLINHKIYIGQSKHPEKRFQEHCHKKEKYCSLINTAINKYGENNFSFEVLGWYENYNEKEKEYIAKYRCITPYGYNIAKGGEEPPIGSNTKITKAVAEKVQQELLDWSIPRRQIVKKYHLTEDIVRHINDGNSWRKEELNYPLRPAEKELNKERVKKVISLLQTTNLTHTEIGKIVGWNRSAVTMINNGKNHRQDELTYPIRAGRHYETCNDQIQ